MEIHVADLSEANLSELPDWSAQGHGQDLGCKFCLYWEEPDREQWPESLEERAEHHLLPDRRCEPSASPS
jgi:hypothetical protein